MTDIVGTNGQDTLVGGAGEDTLDGGACHDVLIGAGGNDFYIVDDGNDLVFENAGEGYDTVQSSVSYAMAANVEAVVLTGSDSLWADGNDLDNSIVANAGNNDFEGYGGNDTLDGGAGWDVAYFRGNFDEYDFALLPDGSLQVCHRNDGIDGTDTLVGVEALSFADNYFDVATIVDFILGNGTPQAAADTATIDENGSIVLDVLANDTDGDWNGPLHIANAAISNGQGSVSVQNGQLVYAAGVAYDHLGVGQTASVDITYTVSDQYGGTATATATITLVGSNDGPVVHDKSYQTVSGAVLTGNVLADTGNGADSDPEGDALHVAAGTYATAQGGTVTVDADGNFAYASAGGGYTGADSFSYAVDDGNGGSETGTVQIQVAAGGGETPPNTGGVDVVLTPASVGLPEIHSGNGAGWSESDVHTATLRDGSYVVAWTAHNDSVGNCIQFQRFAANGVKIGDPVLASNAGMEPDVAALADGGFMVTWSGRSHPDRPQWAEIHGQRYDASGSAVGGDVVLNSNLYGSYKANGDIQSLADGGLVIVWNAGYSVAATVLNADGSIRHNDFSVPAIGSMYMGGGSVAAMEDGSFFVSWNSHHQLSGPDGIAADVYIRHFSAQGDALSDDIKVNTNSNILLNQVSPTMTTLSNGTFVVTWRDQAIDGNEWGIGGRIFDASGQPIGTDFRVNTYALDFQMEPSVAALPNGGFVVSWFSGNQDGSGFGVYAQRFDAAGQAIGGEFLVNTYTLNDQVHPSVTALHDGGFVVAWSSWLQDGSQWGVYSQQFDADGNKLSQPDYYAGTPIALGISTDFVADATHLLSFHIDGLPVGATLSAGTHDAAGTWTVTQAELSGLTLMSAGDFAGHVHLGVSAILTDTTNGTQSVSTQSVDFDIRDPAGLYGQSGADTLTGGSGADRLYGEAGNDLLVGNGGTDILTGGAGNDTLTGGAGSDHFRFEAASGNDVVTDFQQGPAGDVVDLVGTSIHSFTQAQVAMTQQGADVVLDLGGGNQVQFLNTLLADFDASRFNYG